MSQPLHQQQGGVSLATFAKAADISVQRARLSAKAGRIIGARQHPLTKKWWIYPPAILLKASQL